MEWRIFFVSHQKIYIFCDSIFVWDFSTIFWIFFSNGSCTFGNSNLFLYNISIYSKWSILDDSNGNPIIHQLILSNLEKTLSIPEKLHDIYLFFRDVNHLLASNKTSRHLYGFNSIITDEIARQHISRHFHLRFLGIRGFGGGFPWYSIFATPEVPKISVTSGLNPESWGCVSDETYESWISIPVCGFLRFGDVRIC